MYVWYLCLRTWRISQSYQLQTRYSFRGLGILHQRLQWYFSNQYVFWLAIKVKVFSYQGGSGHARHLQIVDQSVLPHEDCTKLCKSFEADIKYLIHLIVESIKSTKNVSKSQLCAGHKIVKRKPTKFYEYTGEHRQTNFTEIDPIKEGYKDKYHDKVAFTSYIPWPIYWYLLENWRTELHYRRQGLMHGWLRRPHVYKRAGQWKGAGFPGKYIHYKLQMWFCTSTNI